MKIKIDSQKINSNYIDGDVRNTNVEVQEIKDQLVQQLKFGNNSSFLISGYRGAGKTTLISDIEDEIKKDNNYVFVHLNISKYESYSLILRKLIREIYLTLSSSEVYKKIEDKQLKETIELLYDHTFYEVFKSSSVKNLKELNISMEGSFNLKDVLKAISPLLAVIIASLNISFDIISIMSGFWNIIVLILSICWFFITSFKLNLKKQKNNSALEELNRKSLYDDEIAEYHLKNILEKLKKEDIKVIFVFDELDKIENEVDMNNTISDLKPLLLSNLASFIVISGQKLYYKFINSSVLDDSIMTSIFAKTIHVSLSTNISLKKLFNSYINEPSDVNNELINNYSDSLILNSYRTLRKFNNLILQNIEWENNESYLYIDEFNLNSYKTDSIILEILMEMTENSIEISDHDNGVKDFLTYQLFIWIKKMKLKGKLYFTNNEIYSFEEDYSEQYPIWTKFQLNEICNELISKLLDKKLLEKTILNDGDEILYRWTVKADIKVEGINKEDEQSIDKIRFLDSMNEIERHSRNILMDLKENDQDYNKKSLNKIREELINIGIVKEYWLNNKNIDLVEVSSKIKHGQKLSVKDTDNILKNSNYVRNVMPQLFENYCFYVVDKYLSPLNYNVTKNNRELDIIAQHNELPDIVIEVKYKNFSTNHDIDIAYRLLKTLEKYNDNTQKKNKLVLFWFSRENEKAYEKFKNQIKKIISNDYPELKDDVYLFYASENESGVNSDKMKVYLDEVIQSSSVRTRL